MELASLHNEINSLNEEEIETLKLRGLHNRMTPGVLMAEIRPGYFMVGNVDTLERFLTPDRRKALQKHILWSRKAFMYQSKK